jgi:flavodoxin
MKALIVYASVHHQNTEKVAKVMAEELGADLVPIGQAQPSTLTAYDLIGFGSGVYGKKFHKTLIQFVEALPAVTGGNTDSCCSEKAADESRILHRG